MSANGNILISACLLGNPVRYNGTDLLLEHSLITKWQHQNRLISICPEVAGGMFTPREPAEIVKGSGDTVLSGSASVMDKQGRDVTKPFVLGAEKALKMAMDNQCRVAIMTECSPSCGSSKMYNGTFTGTLIDGMGVTTALLERHGIRVFNQHQLEEVEDFFLCPE